MFVDENGKFRSQRDCPSLAGVGIDITEISESSLDFVVSISSKKIEISTASDVSNVAEQVVVWKDQVDAFLFNERVQDFFQKELGGGFRLVLMNFRSPRIREGVGGSYEMGFADGYPVLVCNEASLEALSPDSPLDPRRFRANVWVSGLAPFFELKLDKLKLGPLKLGLGKPCQRCQVIMIDPDSLEVSKEPTEFIKKKKHPEGLVFGQNFVHGDIGKVSLGDKVEII